jgi:hypothetical protein
MKFYVLRLVIWLPNEVSVTYTIFSSNLHNELFKVEDWID